MRAKPPHKIYAFIERGEIETVVIGRSRRGKTRSRQAAAPWAEGLRPIPSSQPENKNSPRQLESEAGLSHLIPRRFRILGAAALPQSENHVGQQQCVAFITALHHLSQAGLQSNQRDYAGAPRHQRERAVSCAPKRAAFRGRSSSRCRRQTFRTSCGSFCRTPRGAEAKPSNVNEAIVS